MMRRLVRDVVRRTLVGRHCFRYAMAALALRYMLESVANNGPYWEPDVAYLHWSTDVPAVTVCPATPGHVSTDLTHTQTRPQQPTDRSMPEYFQVDNTLSANIIKWTEDFKKKDSSTLCPSMFKNCYWNGKVFNCCRHFQPHLLVINRPCFSINSQQTVNRRKKLVISHFSKGGELKMEFTEPVKISLHGPTELWYSETQDLLQHVRRVDEDVAFISVVVTNGQTADLFYAVRQIVEDDSLANLDFLTRGCVLHGEKKLHRHPVYSQSACQLECALREPHTYAKNRSLCDCPPTCGAIEINPIWNGTRRSLNNVTSCVLTISKPATERLVMKAKKDYVDLIVIFSCLLQLFAGFNLLEIPKIILNQNKSISGQR